MAAKILVVDDEPMVRKVIRTKLESCGYHVNEAIDGTAAIREVQNDPPDLVISDILMPDCDGIEVVMSLRKSHPQVKVIAISGAGSGLFLDSARALGAEAVLSKPFSMDELHKMVDSVLTDC